MPQYTLRYFWIRGTAELCRLIFAQAEQEFLDHRMQMEEWAEEKKKKERYPFGVVPVLEVDGKVLTESLAIARYLAAEFGLYGKDNMEKAKCDIVVEVLREVRYSLTSINPFNLKETDEAKIAQMKADAFSGKVATKLAGLEDFLKANNGGKGFFVGDSVTWADLALADMGFNMLNLYPPVFDKTPLLKALFDRVMALPNVKRYCAARPATPA